MKGPLSESYHCKALISQIVFKYVFLFAKLKFLRNKIQESKWNIMGQWIDQSILLSGTRTPSLYKACLFWGKREGEEKLLENECDDSFLQDGGRTRVLHAVLKKKLAIFITCVTSYLATYILSLFTYIKPFPGTVWVSQNKTFLHMGHGWGLRSLPTSGSCH